jgi:hypothetical protein
MELGPQHGEGGKILERKYAHKKIFNMKTNFMRKK